MVANVHELVWSGTKVNNGLLRKLQAESVPHEEEVIQSTPRAQVEVDDGGPILTPTWVEDLLDPNALPQRGGD